MSGSAPPRAIVFDLDGTLVDSLADIAEAANHSLASYGRSALSEHAIARYVGDGARMLVARAAGLDAEHPDVERLLASFIEYYTAHAADHTTLMPGAELALAELAPLPLAICTNKPRAVTLRVLERLGLAERFSRVLAGGDVPRPKPDPLPLLSLAAELGLEPRELVMVGDGPQDVECGRRAGARTVGLLGGIADSAKLSAAHPDVTIASLSELPAVIATWTRQATSA